MIAALLCVASASLYTVNEEKTFLAWMRSSNQIYTGDEYSLRFGIFMANSRLVEDHNRKSTFKVGLNKFAAMTPAEYKALLGRRPVVKRATKPASELKDDPPASIDWRTSGVVNAVKDQGQCGSCWAFGTIQACESAYAIKNKKLFSLSEQNLVDCATGECQGCNGGLESAALDYILLEQGGFLMAEEDYPYKAVEGTCKFDGKKAIDCVESYRRGKAGDEEYLKTLVGTVGVADVAIDASHWSFQLYTGGIYDEPSCISTMLDHAVGCVGYGSENGVDYWIIRNSWGPNWGEDGYIRMVRNKHNQCGVASDALVPNAAQK